MRQLLIFLGVMGALVGAGLAVPRPALAIPPFDCPVVFSGAFDSNSLLIYQIDEVTGQLVTSEGNRCFIETQSFGTAPVRIDALEQGQDRFNPTGTTPVSDYADLIFEPDARCVTASPCTSVTLQSDLTGSSGETGLPSRCVTPNDAGACVRFLEDANGLVQDPDNTTVNTPFGHIACSQPSPSTGVISCLNIVSDAENQEIAVPEPSSALLLGAVLPGLFGFRRLSRRDRSVSTEHSRPLPHASWT